MDNPILLDFPYSFDTERLTIRGPLPGDGRAIHEAIVSSRDELIPWMPWAVEAPSEEESELRAREGQIKFLAREDLWLPLFLRETGFCIGGSGLHRIDWSVPKFEIGYWVRTGYSGRGYITEAVNAITEFAFDLLGARRLEIRCDILNARSAAVARRVGFNLEATLRQDTRDQFGRLRDTHIFSRIKADE